MLKPNVIFQKKYFFLREYLGKQLQKEDDGSNQTVSMAWSGCQYVDIH